MNIRSLQIEDLANQFCDQTLPKERWNHEGHLIVGMWHLFNFPFDNAVDILRKRIIDYNDSLGTINSDDSGYHETLTLFWMITLKNFIMQYPHHSLEEVCHLFLDSAMASKAYPLQFYSKVILMSRKARRTWVDGDIKTVAILP